MKSASPNDLKILLRGCEGQSALDLRDRAMIGLVWTTGMRTTEVCSLRTEDIDLVRGLVTILDGKGHKDRVVPIQQWVGALLHAYRNRGRGRLLPQYPVRGHEGLAIHEPGWFFLARDNGRRRKSLAGQLTRNGYLQMQSRRYVAGGGDRTSFGGHRLRHGNATYLISQGVDISVVKDLHGHSTIALTQRYVHNTADTIRDRTAEAMAKVAPAAARSRGRSGSSAAASPR